MRSKIWIEVDGKPVMGTGRVDILRAIDRWGSIQQASKRTGIPYRRIWGALKEMETSLGFPLVRTHRGGTLGGWSSLTPRAKGLIERFDRLQAGLQDLTDVRFREVFEDFF